MSFTPESLARLREIAVRSMETFRRVRETCPTCGLRHDHYRALVMAADAVTARAVPSIIGGELSYLSTADVDALRVALVEAERCLARTPSLPLPPESQDGAA